MPAYAYRCRECDADFEVRRAITDEPGATPCPQGHVGTTRVFSAVAVGGRAGAAPASSGAGPASGGCCGGGCCG